MFYDSFNHTIGSGICAKEAATVMEDDSVKPSLYEDFTEGAMVAVAESETNYTKLMMGIGITEAVAYSETGEAMVYTEGFISDVVDKIKAFFKKVWDKIKALFKRFVLMFDQYFKNDKDFLKKYKSRIMKSSTKDLTFNGYPFSKAVGVTSGIYVNSKSIDEVKASINKINEDIDADLAKDKFDPAINGGAVGDKMAELREDMLDAIRAQAINKSGTVSASDFAEELFEYFHGSTTKESLSDSDPEVNLSNCIMILEKNKETTKNIQKVLDKIGKIFDDMIKEIEKNMKETNAGYKDSDDGKVTKTDKVTNNTKFVNTKISIYRGVSSIATQMFGAALTASKDMNRQARAICAKAIVKSGKINEESAGSEYFGGGSFLSGVVFK